MEKQNYTIIINAPIEKAFEVLSHKDTNIQSYGHEDQERKEGIQYRLTIGGLAFEGEIIAYRKPILFGVGLKHFLLSGSFFSHLSEIDDNTTKLDCELEIYEGNKFKEQLAKISLPALNKIVNLHLKQVKKLAEKKEITA